MRSAPAYVALPVKRWWVPIGAAGRAAREYASVWSFERSGWQNSDTRRTRSSRRSAVPSQLAEATSSTGANTPAPTADHPLHQRAGISPLDAAVSEIAVACRMRRRSARPR
ncbi:uncharacterized protein LOC126260512 [Schistocerca nitens]|uniref:uncharacterized protein LOC126260512 n=1 Tax=Schistocerca nitens TaxID=7011 RepID=UPI0021175E0C|nr:uncharacterized protein LOC126260512 [Schistocerca nitens]